MKIGRMGWAGVAAAVAVAAVLVAASAQERPREGDRGRETLVVVPISKMPDADVLASLDKVFGKQLKITADKDLKVLIIQGRESIVDAAVQAVADCIDRTPPPVRRDGDAEAARSARAVQAVQLNKADPAMVIKLVKQHISDKLEIVERPSAKALIFEGDRASVEQAAKLARQHDGQLLHPSVRRIIVPREGEGRGDRDP